MKPELIAPCGMNCAICIAYMGYHMNGSKKKVNCTGCRVRNKNCAFIMKRCKYLPKKEIEFCFECKEFPCENLKKLDKKYRTKYNMSMVENLKFIKEHGMEKFLHQQEKRYRCPDCGGVICVHNKRCYGCAIPSKSKFL
jgi:hypothetical protein